MWLSKDKPTCLFLASKMVRISSLRRSQNSRKNSVLTPFFLFPLPLPSRYFPDAQFLWSQPSSSQSAPEFRSHAAHGSSCSLDDTYHAQQLAEHPPGTDADLPAECNADEHATSPAAHITGVHRHQPANSNADQPADADTEQLTESIAGVHICFIQHGEN